MVVWLILLQSHNLSRAAGRLTVQLLCNSAASKLFSKILSSTKVLSLYQSMTKYQSIILIPPDIVRIARIFLTNGDLAKEDETRLILT